MLRIETRRFHYSLHGDWHMNVRSCCVRHVFLLRAAYFRQVLHHAAGFPRLGLTMLDTTPTRPGFFRFRLGSLSRPFINAGFRIVPFPGFPERLNTVSPYSCRGSGGSPKFLCASFHTCRGLGTPSVLHLLAVCRSAVSPAACMNPCVRLVRVVRRCLRPSRSRKTI